ALGQLDEGRRVARHDRADHDAADLAELDPLAGAHRAQQDRVLVGRAQRAGPDAPGRHQLGLAEEAAGRVRAGDAGGEQHQKMALTDSPVLIRRIASPKTGATERTCMFGNRFSGGIGTVLVVMISWTSSARSRSIAAPEKTPCVQATVTPVTPRLRSSLT